MMICLLLKKINKKMLNKIKDEIAKIRFLRMFYIKYLKRFDNKARIYLTMSCNLNCLYCVNQFFKDSQEDRLNQYEIIEDYKKWANAINREKKDVIFTGGEPTLYPHFIELLNGIDSSVKIQVDTNMVWSEEFLQSYIHGLKRPIKLYASYHPVAGNPGNIIRTVKELKKYKKFEGYIHMIDAGLSKDYIKKSKRVFSNNGIPLMIDEDQYGFFEGSSKKFRKKIICRKKVYLIAPDGDRYPCVSYLIRQRRPLENFIKDGLKSPLSITYCNDYGFCAPCDGLGEMSVEKITGKSKESQ